MKTSHDELQRYEELLQWGTPLDAMLLEKAKAACRGLEIVQSGTPFENVIYSKAGIGSEIMLSVQIENISDTVIRIDAIRLKMPWFDDDFRWLKKLSSKDLRECAGYVLPACGQWGFDQSVVLNRLLVRDFKLFPGDVIEGLLLGEGASSIPD